MALNTKLAPVAVAAALMIGGVGNVAADVDSVLPADPVMLSDTFAANSIALADGAVATTGGQASRLADEPAILAALDEQGTQAMDDSAAAAVRGAARTTKYVMNRMYSPSSGIGLHTDSFAGTNATKGSWTTSGTSWRYGYWGGSGWSDGGSATYNRNGSFVDKMDELFRAHDNLYTDANGNSTKLLDADAFLMSMLKILPKSAISYFGSGYVSSPANAPEKVKIVVPASGYTTKTVYMPFSEYARRQALAAFTAKGVWSYANGKR